MTCAGTAKNQNNLRQIPGSPVARGPCVLGERFWVVS